MYTWVVIIVGNIVGAVHFNYCGWILDNFYDDLNNSKHFISFILLC